MRLLYAAVDARRITEMVGSFVLGGGLVAVLYELLGGQPLLTGSDGGPEVAQASDTPTARAAQDDGDRSADAFSAIAQQAQEHKAEAAEDGEPSEGIAQALGELANHPAFQVDPDGKYLGFLDIYDPVRVLDDEGERDFPMHGLITSGAATVREAADVESKRLGLLRAGTRLRTNEGVVFGGGCSKGWHKIHPEGFVCKNAGLDVASSPPDDGLVAVKQPAVDAPLPYVYWRVNHDGTPFFHRLPSYEEQDRADRAAKNWLADKGREPMPSHPDERPDEVPAAVKEYLNAGYYVTVASEHVKSKRRFVRTNRGHYARKYQLEQRKGADFRGHVIEGGAQDLPIYWIVRELPLMDRENAESDVLLKSETTLDRRSRHPFKRKVRIGDYEYYEDADGRLLRAYAVGVAQTIDRPAGIGPQEHWVHVDLSEQVLVAYAGDTPVFTTLVSTGKEEGMTPVGVFRVQSKYVATSMRDQPVEEEAYSIEDVPWTQYFDGNVAIHGAFWHGGFGLVRSHGCVNLSPADARWIFGFTHPALPAGWDAIWPGHAGNGQGSAVVVTE